MSTQKWACDECEELFDAEEEAEQCEEEDTALTEAADVVVGGVVPEWTPDPPEVHAARLGMTVEEFHRRVDEIRKGKKGE